MGAALFFRRGDEDIAPYGVVSVGIVGDGACDVPCGPWRGGEPSVSADAHGAPTVSMACPVFDDLFSFHQRKEKRKRNAARDQWSLDLLARLYCPKTGKSAATRIGRRIFPGWKCWIAPTPRSAAAFPLKGRSRYFYRRKGKRLSGGDAEAILDFAAKLPHRQFAVQGVTLSDAYSRAKEVLKPSVSKGVFAYFFRDTPKIRANGDGFLAGGTHAARSA